MGAADPRGRRARGTVDFLGEPWSYPLPPTPIADGSIEGRIEDAQGRLNLNNAAQDGKAGDAERARLAQLFAAKGVDPRMLDSLADWIDEDDAARRRRGGRVVRAAVARRGPRQRAARAHGRDRLVARRARGDVGRARRKRRRAAARNVDQHQHGARRGDHGGHSRSRRREARAFIAERARKPFTTMGELRERMPRGVTLPEGASFAFASSYFIVSVRSRQGESVARARALLKRDGRTWPTVVWQVLE